ncbi:hypothetical protein BC938DRAFT_478076 [Jimgerdemannia flammicorona]|uniref:No apical meristem-associated C-terminal domain-containing protein n=1 Tax=Jimgerdemannia flammicorona TaxID=994334 RepID=A0A433QNG4_9FUNG|nr:hypothetical protein BC938DRAFT_478076 [Jimgerdemannia flammicorona]
MADNLAHSPADSTSSSLMTSCPSSMTSRPSSPLSSPLPSDLKKRKGKNFSIPENEQLCHSWLNILQDPVAGTRQKAVAFWQKIHQHYNEFKETETEHTEDLLCNCWGFIAKVVSKFCGAMAQIDSYDKNTKYLYLITVNSTFSLDYYWDILKDTKKWQDFCAVKKPPRTPKGLKYPIDETDDSAL